MSFILRLTLSVPAVYYAHLASNRARAHESAPASDGARGGQKYEEAQQDQAVARAAGAPSARGGSSQTGTSLPIEARPLLPLGNPEAGAEIITKIRTSMCKFIISNIRLSELTMSRVYLSYVNAQLISKQPLHLFITHGNFSHSFNLSLLWPAFACRWLRYCCAENIFLWSQCVPRRKSMGIFFASNDSTDRHS